MTGILCDYEKWMKENRYICASLLYPKKGRTVVYGTIVNVDFSKKKILIYDDDFKQVVMADFKEIDDIRLAQKNR